MPCQPQAGAIFANVGQEAPHRFSGYSTVAQAVSDPHTPGHRSQWWISVLPWGAGRPSHPGGCRVAVLVPPTGNGVLNQIPAGDGRESSREQAVPDDGVPLHGAVKCWGRETTSPLWLPLVWRQSCLPHPKKKKKKKNKKKKNKKNKNKKSGTKWRQG